MENGVPTSFGSICAVKDAAPMPFGRVCTVRDGAQAPFGGVWVVADSPLLRLRGLAGRRPDRTVMVFPRCRDVHTLTMRHPLDIAFLDGEGRVTEVHRLVLPGARLRCSRAAAVIERFARPGPWFVLGDRCSFGNVPSNAGAARGKPRKKRSMQPRGGASRRKMAGTRSATSRWEMAGMRRRASLRGEAGTRVRASLRGETGTRRRSVR